MSLVDLEKRIQAIEDRLEIKSVATKEAETVIEQPETVIEQPETVIKEAVNDNSATNNGTEETENVTNNGTEEAVNINSATNTSDITFSVDEKDAAEKAAAEKAAAEKAAPDKAAADKAAADKAASDKNNTIISLEYADGTSKYKGTVGNLFSMISAKIGQLQSNKGSKDYKDKAAKLAKMLSDFKEPTTTVEKIKSDIIESPLLFGFKNNKIFGGKSKRRSKKSKKSKKTKRR